MFFNNQDDDFDEDKYNLSKYGILIPIFIIIIAGSLLLVRCSNNNLQGYTESSSMSETSSTAEKKKEKEINVKTYTYKDNDNNFTINIPEQWLKVNGQNNNVSFVDRSTGSKLDISISDYYPQINLINQDYMTQQAAANNKQLQEFNKKGNHSYSLSYNDDNYGYIEYTYWDLSKVINLSFTIDIKKFNDENMSSLIKYINNSFKWKQNNPIPDDLTMTYIESANCEIGLVTDWTYGESSNSILTTNKDESAAFSITINQTNSTLDQISQVDYANYLSQSKDNFVMKSFSNDGQKIICTGSYTLNDKNIDLQQYIYCNGQNEYIISFDTEQAVTADLASTIQEIINTFKIY